MGLSHLAIANSTPGIEVVAVCDLSAPLMYFLGKNTDNTTYKDYKKMIKKEELDAVIICVPNALHFDIAKYCMEQQLDVFIEKPFTLSVAESFELCKIASKNNIKGQVGYVNRFNPVFQKVKTLLEEKVIGEPVSYVNKMIGGVILKKNSKGWRNDYTQGGGCLFDYGPHCFDLSTYFFGTKVKVSFSFLAKVFSTNVDDIVSATFLHEDKVVGYNYINWSDASARKASNTIEIAGTQGKIVANKQEISVFVSQGGISGMKEGWNQCYITDENTDIPYYLRGEDFSNQMMEFSDLINGKIECSISPFESALVTDQLLDEVFKRAGGEK